MSTPISISLSVVRVSSADISNADFGTAFVVYDDGTAAFLVTCAHVVRDVGGPEQVVVEGARATVVAAGAVDGTDLAVLRVLGLSRRFPLTIHASGEPGCAITVIGFSRYDRGMLLRPLHGKLGREVGFESRSGLGRIKAWDVRIDDDYPLQPGYSGSPVVHADTGHVVGIMTHMQGDGMKGLAISAAALAELWTERPSELLTDSIVRDRTADERVPEPRPVSRAPYVYVAFNRDRGSVAGELTGQLGVRGIQVSESSRHTIVTRRTVEADVAAAGAAIVYLTPGTLNDEFFATQVRPLVERYEQDPSFPIFTTLDGVTPKQVRRSPLRIEEFSSQVIVIGQGDTERSQALASLARRVMDFTLLPTIERLSSTEAVEVELIAHPGATPSHTRALLLNWKPLFMPRAPHPATWQALLLPALEDVQAVLRRWTVRTLHVYPFARLSAGLALGFVFRETSGFHLHVFQQGTWWRTTDSGQDGPFLQVDEEDVSDHGRDITIEVSVTQPMDKVSIDVQQLIQTQQLPIRTRIHIGVPPGTRLDGQVALHLARTIRSRIVNARSQQPVHVTHLLGAMPVGLAVLIGWHLNACGIIQGYELVQRAPDQWEVYEPACRLE